MIKLETGSLSMFLTNNALISLSFISLNSSKWVLAAPVPSLTEMLGIGLKEPINALSLLPSMSKSKPSLKEFLDTWVSTSSLTMKVKLTTCAQENVDT